MHKILCACALVTVIAGCKQQDDTARWTGAGDGVHWSDAHNWQPASVPTDAKTIVINKAVVTVASAVDIKTNQTLIMRDAVIRVSSDGQFANSGLVSFRNASIFNQASGVFANDGRVVGDGSLSLGCGGGAAPDTGQVAASVGQVICATPCDPNDACCEPSGPTGCTHTAAHWRHQTTWPLQLEPLCRYPFIAILAATDFDDLEDPESSESDACSDSSSSESDEAEGAWFDLAHAYIAARVNQADGASSLPRVDLALEEAEALLSSNCQGVQTSEVGYLRELTAVLTEYNTGNTAPMGPGLCEGENPFVCRPKKGGDDDDDALGPPPQKVCYDTGYGTKKCLITRGGLATSL